MSDKTRLAIYLEDKTNDKLERWYTANGNRSKSSFIEKAINFYADYLSANDANSFLPVSVTSVMEGRLGMFEDRMASLLFKQTVELSMIMQILAAELDIGEVDLNSLRGKCVADVKRTNGRLTFSDILKQRRTI